MAIPKFLTDLAFISKMKDNPRSDGLSTSAFRAEFDKAALLIQKYLNETLIPHLDNIVDVEALLKNILDTTLTKEKCAAEAKVTGEKFSALEAKTGVKTYTDPAVFGCKADSTPAEIREKLPNGSILLCVPEQLTNEAWNFPAGLGLVQMMKGIALDLGGNSARVKTLFYGKGSSQGDWQAVTDSSGTPTGEWLRMPCLVTKTATLTIAGWEGDSAPYTQTVSVDGVTKQGSVNVHPVWPDTQEGDLALQEALSMVTQAKRDDGKLIFTCRLEKPSTDIPIEVEVLV